MYPFPAPADFEAVDTTVTFPAGSVTGRRVCFPVNITDDMAYEKAEDFSLVLVDVSGDDNIILHIDTLIIRISDNDSKYMHSDYLNSICSIRCQAT